MTPPYWSGRRRLRAERLDDRITPAALVGLTTAGALVTFDSTTPGTVSSPVAITGLQTGESVVGIDTRPANGKLYAVGSTSRLYTVDAATGAATAVGAAPFTTALAGTSFGVDFNPAVDKLRVVSDTGQNLRINADDGTVISTDGTLTYDPATFDAAVGGTPPAPQVVATAYTKNANPTTGATVTTQYVIDAGLDILATQGSAGDADVIVSPNTGTLFAVDKLGFDAGPDTGFEIVAGTDEAFAVSGGKLYGVNLTTGAGKVVGTTGGLTTINLRGVTVAATPAGPGTFTLTAATLAFDADRGPLAVTVVRSGGATGAVSVDYATADGTAKAGTDYAANAGTLTFAAGQTSRTVFLSLPAGPPAASDAKTFTLTLSNPTGGAALGTTKAATVTIPAVTAPPADGQYFAAASGSGAEPRVRVYEATSGKESFSFLAYEASFTGGITVATGDLTGDGVEDIVVGSGVGGGPRIRVFDGQTRAQAAEFFAYEDTFRGGVNVALGDVNGDGFPDLLIGSGVGGGPRVRVFDGDAAAAGKQTVLADFFAYEDTFRGGVNVASGEFTGDQFADIVAGAGFLGGPRIRVFDGKTLAPRADFFAYEDTFRNGVLVAAGDVDGNGVADLVAGSGPGGGPAVRAFDGKTNAAIQSFFAFDQANRGGVRVATQDTNADGTDEILAGSGAGGAAQVRVFSKQVQLSAVSPFDAAFTGGVFVG